MIQFVNFNADACNMIFKGVEVQNFPTKNVYVKILAILLPKPVFEPNNHCVTFSVYYSRLNNSSLCVLDMYKVN